MTSNQGGKAEAPLSSATVTVGVAAWRLANIRIDTPPSGPRVRRKRGLKQICERKSAYFFEGGTTRVLNYQTGHHLSIPACFLHVQGFVLHFVVLSPCGTILWHPLSVAMCASMCDWVFVFCHHNDHARFFHVEVTCVRPGNS